MISKSTWQRREAPVARRSVVCPAYDVIARGLTDTAYLHEDIRLSSVAETFHYYMIQVCFVSNCSELE